MIAAVWSAFGLQCFVMLMDFYRNRYNAAIPFPNILTTAVFLCYIVLVILAYVAAGFTPGLIGPIVVSTMFAAVLLSMIFGHPFTLQHSSHKVDEVTRKSPEFLKFNMALSAFWLLLFGVMMASIWVGYGVFHSDPNSIGYIILGIVIPVLMPILGFFLTPKVSVWLMGSAVKKHDDEAGGGEEKENLLGKKPQDNLSNQ